MKRLITLCLFISLASCFVKQNKSEILPVTESPTLNIPIDSIDIKSDNKEETAAINYEAYCSSCHGKALNDFVDRKWVYGKTKSTIEMGLWFGYPDDGMPSFQETFSEKEFNELVDFIYNAKATASEVSKPKSSRELIKSDDQNFSIEKIVELDHPWGMAQLPDLRFLITERGGDLYIIDGTEKIKVTGLPEVKASGQGGLLDVIIHPDFKKNKYVYLSYSKPVDNLATTAIGRAKLNGNELLEFEELFSAHPALKTRHHYGSRMVFDQNGDLFFSVGDRGKRDENPQFLNNDCGKIHRLDDRGAAPLDNPYMNARGAQTSIYSYGHRNPQGIAMHPETGKIWAHEHGPKGGDELNLIKPKVNYGWPVISYGVNYSGTKFTDLKEKEGMEQPKTYWVPSIAPCGMTFVEGNNYKGWKNNILVGSLRFEYIERVVLDGEEVTKQEKLLEGIGRLRSIVMGKDGFIYFCVEEGGVYKIYPEG